MSSHISMRDGINIIEDATTPVDPAIANKLNIFLSSTIGELVKYTFEGASTPQQLQHDIINTATDVRQSLLSGDKHEARDHGITGSVYEMKQKMDTFLSFAKAVATEPQKYFDAFHDQSQLQENDIDTLQGELPYASGSKKDEIEDEMIDIIAQDRQTPTV